MVNYTGLALRATTGINGYTLLNATPTIISWTPPADGQIHRFIIVGGLRVTSNETGGAIQVSYTYPDGSASNDSLLAANQSTTHQLVTARLACCQGGQIVNVNQQTALTGGAAVAWLEIWGSLEGESWVMPAYDNAVLADSPVLYVTGAAADASGRGHQVTAHGSPLPAASAVLPDGSAGWDFGPSGGQYLSVADAADLSVSATGALTVECWHSPRAVNQPGQVNSGYVNFVSKAGYTSPPGIQGNEWELRYFSQDTTDPGNAGESLCGYAYAALDASLGSGHDDAAGVTPGQWIHTAVTYDCTGSPSVVAIYRNGVQVNSTTFTGTPQDGPAPLTIGAGQLQQSDANFWYGRIGKIAVYPSALPAARIQAHHRVMTGAD